MACDTTYAFTPTKSLISHPDIRLFPNPVFSGSSQFHIKGPDRSNWRLRDIHGQMLYQSAREESGKVTANLPTGLSPGLYLVEIHTDEQYFVRKLIVN